MSYDGNGLYQLPAPDYPAIPGNTILAEEFNTIMADIAAALSSVLVKDGQAPMTGSLDMGSQSITNITVIAAAVTGLIVSGAVTFTGSAKGPTMPLTDDSTNFATTAFVQDMVFGDPYNALLAILSYRNY